MMQEENEKQGIKLAVVGGRDFEDEKLFYDSVDRSLQEIREVWGKAVTEIVSGGAKGADTFAAEYAEVRSLALKVFPANWKKYGRAAGPKRNREIVEYADLVVAFWDGQSTGTAHTISQAKERGKLHRVIHYGPQEPSIDLFGSTDEETADPERR